MSPRNRPMEALENITLRDMRELERYGDFVSIPDGQNRFSGYQRQVREVEAELGRIYDNVEETCEVWDAKFEEEIVPPIKKVELLFLHTNRFKLMDI